MAGVSDFEFKFKEVDLDGLDIAIENIQFAMFGQAVQSSLSTATRPMAKAAAARVVQRERRKQGAGHLVDVIGYRNKQIPRGKRTVAEVGVGVRSAYKGRYKPSSRWHLEEFGFKHRRKGTFSYFRPAFSQHKDLLYKNFVLNMEKNIRKAARGKLRLGARWSGTSGWKSGWKHPHPDSRLPDGKDGDEK